MVNGVVTNIAAPGMHDRSLRTFEKYPIKFHIPSIVMGFPPPPRHVKPRLSVMNKTSKLINIKLPLIPIVFGDCPLAASFLDSLCASLVPDQGAADSLGGFALASRA